MGFDSRAIQALLTPSIQTLGYEIWGCVPDPHSGVVRLYIDKDNGISARDCECVSRQAHAVLAIECSRGQATYRLEVSSPGLSRPLFTPDQYRRYIGSKLRIRTRIPLMNRRRFVGQLQSVSESGILLAGEQLEQSIMLEWDVIARANLVPQFE